MPPAAWPPRSCSARPSSRRTCGPSAARCDVVTFDHEQVDLDLVADAGGPGRGGPTRRRRRSSWRSTRPTCGPVLDEAGVPVPAYLRGRRGARTRSAPSTRFAAAHGWPVMLKAARGGYDGKGVWPVGRPGRGGRRRWPAWPGRSWWRRCSRCRPSWPSWWPGVPPGRRWPGRPSRRRRWAGSAGRCSCRAGWTPDVLDAASALGQKVAEIAGGVGVMAVELFWSGGRLLVNEVATRPHNSGHWTMEGAVTSQFENHVRAVLDLPLGSTAPQHAQVASVNVFGGPGRRRSGRAARPGPGRRGRPRAPVWQRARPGRKLGHVTVCGDDAEVVRARAWAAALALGTPVPDGHRAAGGSGPMTRPGTRWWPS